MTAVTNQATTRTHTGLTNSPIFFRSDVNITSGTTANGSCRLRITCDNTSNFAVPDSP